MNNYSCSVFHGTLILHATDIIPQLLIIGESGNTAALGHTPSAGVTGTALSSSLPYACVVNVVEISIDETVATRKGSKARFVCCPVEP